MRFPFLNDTERYLSRFRSVKRSNCAIRLGHFDGIVPSLLFILTKQIPCENPWKRHFQDSNFQNVPIIDGSALKHLCLWCKFQSHLLFIISLLLKNFLTALE